MPRAIIMRTSKLLSLIATLLAATTFGCRADGPRIIIVDGWWARDFAVQACAQPPAGPPGRGGERGGGGWGGGPPRPPLMPVLLACPADSARRQARVFE